MGEVESAQASRVRVAAKRLRTCRVSRSPGRACGATRPLHQGRGELKSPLHVGEGLAESVCEAFAFGRRQVAGDDEALAARDERQPREAEILVALAVKLRPQWVEAPLAALAAVRDAAEQKLERRQHHLLE